MYEPLEANPTNPAGSLYQHKELRAGDPRPAAPSPTFLGEINLRLGTIGVLLSDIQSSSASVRERLLGAWPAPPPANSPGSQPHPDYPAAEVLARLDILIERAAACRDNTQALDARV